MRTLQLPFFCIAGLLFLASCVGPRDELELAALQASRAGTYAGEGHGGRDTVGLEAGARVTERYYYVAKYRATAEQRTEAERVARRAAPRLMAQAKKMQTAARRYIAVPTRQDARAKTGTSVMIWSTESEQIVGNDVYDLNSAPPVSALVKLETYSAQYVGGL